jgi:PIF1-like helicase
VSPGSQCHENRCSAQTSLCNHPGLCFPSEPSRLWDAFKQHICDDIRHQLQTRHNIQDPEDDQVYDFGLFLLGKNLLQAGRSLTLCPDMPLFTGEWEVVVGNRFMAEQRDYDPIQEQQQADEDIAILNVGQRAVYDEILHSVLNREGKMFFVTGSGGAGKSFTWNTLIHSCRGHRLIVISVASSAMAALILLDGWTSHSMLGIPIPVHEGSFSYIKKNSGKPAMLKDASLIIWDEAAMQHRHAVVPIDRTLRDFLDQPDLPFGGIMVTFRGDFQQTLPIVPKGSKEQIVGACLQRSFLWPKIMVFHLTENMHVDRNDPESARFAEWLQNIGQGKDLSLEHTFALPPHMVCGPEISDLIQEIYPRM